MKYVLLLFGNLDDVRCGEEPGTDLDKDTGVGKGAGVGTGTGTGADAAQGPGVEDFIAFDAELEKAGVLAGGFALEDPDTGVSVTLPPGANQPVVTSGPHPENREFVGGTIVIDVADIDEALAWAARCPGVHGGRVEVRALAEY